VLLPACLVVISKKQKEVEEKEIKVWRNSKKALKGNLSYYLPILFFLSFCEKPLSFVERDKKDEG
jgi:hypothetical protein